MTTPTPITATVTEQPRAKRPRLYLGLHTVERHGSYSTSYAFADPKQPQIGDNGLPITIPAEDEVQDSREDMTKWATLTRERDEARAERDKSQQDVRVSQKLAADTIADYAEEETQLEALGLRRSETDGRWYWPERDTLRQQLTDERKAHAETLSAFRLFYERGHSESDVVLAGDIITAAETRLKGQAWRTQR